MRTTYPLWAVLLFACAVGVPAGLAARAAFDATVARAGRARAALATLTQRARGGA